MACHVGDEVEVVVNGEHRCAREFGGGRDEQVGYRRCAMLTEVAEQLLNPAKAAKKLGLYLPPTPDEFDGQLV